MNEATNRFVELASIDVGKYIERKGNLAYLPWAWAVDRLLRADPGASWQYQAPGRFGDTLMVYCTVTAFGTARTMQLPVMDNRNKAVANPDSFAVNTAMQRALVKAIALHGLGLYIYAGEDVPDVVARTEDQEPSAEEATALETLREAALNGSDPLRKAWEAAGKDMRVALQRELQSLKRAAAEADAAQPRVAA
jgi:hypothetical protein